jgi:uncharacterized membrane protein required for colicin V production
MDLGTTDIFLLVVIISTLVVGFFWGAARSVMLLAAWLLAFLAGAYLKLEFGSYLASEWENFPASFSEMAAFGLIYMVLLLLAPVLIIIVTRGSEKVTRFQVLDDLVGAIFAVLMIVLSTFYGTPEVIVDPLGGPDWTANLYQSLLDSNIGSAIAERIIPVLDTLLGPILPADVREAMA